MSYNNNNLKWVFFVIVKCIKKKKKYSYKSQTLFGYIK